MCQNHRGMETAKATATPTDAAAEDRQTPPPPRHLTIQSARMTRPSDREAVRFGHTGERPVVVPRLPVASVLLLK